jgi:hypothetical protein
VEAARLRLAHGERAPSETEADNLVSGLLELRPDACAFVRAPDGLYQEYRSVGGKRAAVGDRKPPAGRLRLDKPH